MAGRGLVFAEMKLSYLPICPREFSLDAFYTGPKTCVDKLSVTRGESRDGCGENQSSPLLLP